MSNEFKEELIAEKAAKPKKAMPKKPAKEEEEWVDLYIDYIEGDAPTQFISITNDVMDRDFLLVKGQRMKVPACVAEVYYSMKEQAAEARRRQNELRNTEIASY